MTETIVCRLSLVQHFKVTFYWDSFELNIHKLHRNDGVNRKLTWLAEKCLDILWDFAMDLNENFVEKLQSFKCVCGTKNAIFSQSLEYPLTFYQILLNFTLNFCLAKLCPNFNWIKLVFDERRWNRIHKQPWNYSNLLIGFDTGQRVYQKPLFMYSV